MPTCFWQAAQPPLSPLALFLRLDYIADLGTDVVYVNPVFGSTGSYHGYCTTDFTTIDAGFGTADDFRQFVEAAHQRGMRVILDIVQHVCIPDATYLEWPAPDCIDLNWDAAQSGVRYQGNSSGTLDFGGAVFPPFDMQEFYYRCGPVYFSEGLSRRQELFGDLRWARSPDTPGAAPAAPGAPPAFRAPAAVAPGMPPSSAAPATAGPENEDRMFALDDLNPHFQTIYTDLMRWWVAYADIDGYRLDAAKHKSTAWSAYFSVSLRAYATSLGKDNFFVSGEILASAAEIREYIGNMTGGWDGSLIGTTAALKSIYTTLADPYPGLTSAYDFPRHWDLRDVLRGDMTPATFVQRAQNVSLGRLTFAECPNCFQFLSLHDYPRITKGLERSMLSCRSTSLASMSMAQLLLAAPGLPIVYYGDEQGFSGDCPATSAISAGSGSYFIEEACETISDAFYRQDMWTGAPFLLSSAVPAIADLANISPNWCPAPEEALLWQYDPLLSRTHSLYKDTRRLLALRKYIPGIEPDSSSRPRRYP